MDRMEYLGAFEGANIILTQRVHRRHRGELVEMSQGRRICSHRAEQRKYSMVYLADNWALGSAMPDDAGDYFCRQSTK